MNFKQIFAICLIFALVLMPVAMAGTGEDGVKKIERDGNITTDGIEKSDDSDEEDDSGEVGDVWGIKQSDAGFEDLANMKTIGGVYMGVTPFKNMSLISISISAGLAITFVLVGIFILVMLAGVGGAHPNVDKGWKMLRGAQGKIVALGIVVSLALFIIILIFFTLTIFGKVIGYMA